MTRKKSYIEEVPIEKTFVDRRVQRKFTDQTRVADILKDFDRNALGVITVSSRPDGRYHIIDGAHRVEALIQLGREYESLTARVWEGLALAEEAAMFRRLNHSRQVTTIDKFRVRVVEEEPVAVALNDILTKYGWKVEWGISEGNFAAVTSFEKLYKAKYRGPGTTLDVCEEVIATLTDVWGHDPSAVRGELVKGLGNVLLRYGARVDMDKLKRELSTFASGPRGLVGQARGLRSFRGGQLYDAVSEILVTLLNKGRRSNRLPDWRDAV